MSRNTIWKGKKILLFLMSFQNGLDTVEKKINFSRFVPYSLSERIISERLSKLGSLFLDLKIIPRIQVC